MTEKTKKWRSTIDKYNDEMGKMDPDEINNILNEAIKDNMIESRYYDQKFDKYSKEISTVLKKISTHIRTYFNKKKGADKRFSDVAELNDILEILKDTFESVEKLK